MTVRAIAVSALVVGLGLAGCASKPVGNPLSAEAGVQPTTDTGPYPSAPASPPPPSGYDSTAQQTSPVVGGVVPGSQQDFVVNVGDRVYFDFDSYAIRSDAVQALEAQAAWLQRNPGVSIRIEGNCDERGTREYNLALGARRASSVAEFLVARGVSGDRISTLSLGKERPVDPGSNEDAWSRNRNGQTIVGGGN